MLDTPSNQTLPGIDTVLRFLLCRTPDSWVSRAVAEIPLLLLDHASLELKAAQQAQTLIRRYGANFDLLNKMSRLAREELRHFEQVIAIMESRSIDYPMVSAGRYAAGMRKNLRKEEPGKLVDTLVIGAIIEARSCERFEKIAPFLDAELKKFYMSLLKSEARHFQDYLVLAGQVVSETEVAARAAVFLTADKELIESADTEFRFHSGMPV